MKLKSRTYGLSLAVSLSIGLAACGGKPDATKANAAESASADPTKPATKIAALNLAAGPNVCFKAISKHLGANAKVSEINSFFSAGKDVDPSEDEPQGQISTCTVNYQNPDDPRKMLSTRMDIATGVFAPSSPVEITVTGGNAAEFKLDDYVMPLSDLNPAALTSVMETQKASLSGVYAKYAWTGVRLMSPDSFNDKHTLRLDVAGRLAANDIKENGYASVSTDGKTVITNNLKP